MVDGLYVNSAERSADGMREEPILDSIGQFVLVMLASAICLVIDLVTTDEDLEETLEDLF